MWLTTAQAAELRGVSRRRITHLLASGRIAGRKLGRDWMVDAASLAAFEPMKRGRPRKGVT